MAKQIICCVPKFMNYKVVAPFEVPILEFRFGNRSWNGSWPDFSVRAANVKNKLGFQVNNDKVVIPPDIVLTCRSTYKGQTWYFNAYQKWNKGLAAFKFNLSVETLEGFHLEEV